MRRHQSSSRQPASLRGDGRGNRFFNGLSVPVLQSVRVFITKVGDGYRVHDGGGAFDAAWLHGRDKGSIGRCLEIECGHYHLRLVDHAIVGEVASAEWLPNLILGVANASSLAAHHAVERLNAAAEETLVTKIDRSLTRRYGEGHFKRGVERIGRSGGQRPFDFALPINGSDSEILISGVLPHAASIYAKFAAFSDAAEPREHKFAVYDKPLASQDQLLLGDAAGVVALPSLTPAADRALAE